MNTEFMGNVEMAIDDLRTRIAALEKAVTQIPQINLQADPSRPAGVVIKPAALKGL